VAKPRMRLDFRSLAFIDLKTAKRRRTRKAPFGSMRPRLSQWRRNHGAGDRHAIFIFRCERRLRLGIICADNHWVGQGIFGSSTPPPKAELAVS
jgi:hypothetical protein